MCTFHFQPRRGWKPGAIGRTIAARIIQHHKAKGIMMSPTLTVLPKKSRMLRDAYETESDATIAPKPTLQIKKKEGCYLITMNPLKDPKTLVENENPYMDCTPLQFKIVKNKDKKVKPNDDEESALCCCGVDDDIKSESSSDSELDIEFTPPAGIIRPERLKRKKNVVHTDTQYNPDDCKPDKVKVGKGKKGKKDKKDKKGKKGKKGKKKK